VKGNILLLWTCQILFIFRVLGQVFVVHYEPSWLPPMKEWYSGLIPYPILLPIQIILIIFMTKVSWDNANQNGYFYVTAIKTKRILAAVSLIYFLIMLTRYVLSMVLVPDNRWFGGTIPIFFHWVLAAYISLLSRNSTEIQ